MNTGYLPYAGVGADTDAGRQRRRQSLIGGVLSALAWGIVGVVGLAMVVGCSQVLVPYMSAVTGPLLGLLLLVSGAEAAKQVRGHRVMMILTYLEQAVRLNLPLPTMLASAEQAERGATKRRLVDLRERLVLGISLSEALAGTVPEASERVLGLIRAAEHTGSLPRALRQILEENGRKPLAMGAATDPMNAAFQRIYPLVMALVLSLVLSMFLIVVMPKFEKIFRDFQVPMPRVTLFVLEFGQSLAVPAAIAVGVICLFVVGRAFERLLVTRSPLRGALGRLSDRLVWVTPLAGGAARDRGLADVFQTLGDATGAGMPLDQALAEVEGLHVNVLLTERIKRWRVELERGLLPAEAARQAGLPPFVAGLLGTARAAEDASAVYHFLARYYRSRFSRVQALLSGASVPAVALVLGVCVATVALAMFQPMVYLIDHLSPRIGGL